MSSTNGINEYLTGMVAEDQLLDFCDLVSASEKWAESKYSPARALYNDPKLDIDLFSCRSLMTTNKYHNLMQFNPELPEEKIISLYQTHYGADEVIDDEYSLTKDQVTEIKLHAVYTGLFNIGIMDDAATKHLGKYFKMDMKTWNKRASKKVSRIMEDSKLRFFSALAAHFAIYLRDLRNSQVSISNIEFSQEILKSVKKTIALYGEVERRGLPLSVPLTFDVSINLLKARTEKYLLERNAFTEALDSLAEVELLARLFKCVGNDSNSISIIDPIYSRTLRGATDGGRISYWAKKIKKRESSVGDKLKQANQDIGYYGDCVSNYIYGKPCYADYDENGNYIPGTLRAVEAEEQSEANYHENPLIVVSEGALDLLGPGQELLDHVSALADEDSWPEGVKARSIVT